MSFKKGIFIFALIGLLLGITLDLLYRYENTYVFYYTLVTLFSYLYVLAYNDKNLVRLIGTSFIVALFLSTPLIGLTPNDSTSNSMHWLGFFAIFPLFVYIGHCFHYAFHHDNTWRVNYTTLFAAVWNTLILLFIAFIFAGIAHLLIMLAAYIFKTVGNFFLWDLFFNNIHFRLICGLTLFFMGLGIAQQNIEIIYSLRFLLLKMMYYLFPFLALISVIYFILFLAHSVSSQKDYIDPLMILLPITIFGIIFFNAYFQDGNTTEDTPNWLKISLRIYRVILFFLALMMSRTILQKTSLDMNALLCLLLAIALCFIYGATALLSEPREQHWIQIGNIATALFFIMALFLVNLPYIPVTYTLGATNPSVSQPANIQQPRQEPPFS
jgi:hypothetical protein